MSKYFGNWSNRDELVRDFEDKDIPADSDVLFAWYKYESYSGNAFVLCKAGDDLFEVNAGHCSCHGLEGQWVPKKTTWKALAMRRVVNEGHSDFYGMDKEALDSLSELVSGHVGDAQ